MLYIEDKVDVETHPILERKTVITLGNFDGIHLGHRQLLDQAIQIAKDRDLATLFFTFSPHSNSLIPSKPKPRLLYTLQQKIHLLEEYGNIDIFLNFCFDETLREMPAAQFFYDILLRRYQAAAIVVGDGFRFGCGGAGDTELLARYCHKEGVYFVKAPCLYWEGEPVSSTRIRRLIEHGRMPEAMKLLGRPYYLEGVVEKGKQLGGKRLAPTVNIALSSDLLYPPNGVYISRTHVDGRAYASVTNLGRNPTRGGGETPRAETHILDYDEDLYGKCLRVDLLEYTRPEIQFDTLDELKSQITKDIENTRRYFEPEQGGLDHHALHGTK